MGVEAALVNGCLGGFEDEGFCFDVEAIPHGDERERERDEQPPLDMFLMPFAKRPILKAHWAVHYNPESRSNRN